jgi:hypothetical protein
LWADICGYFTSQADLLSPLLFSFGVCAQGAGGGGMKRKLIPPTTLPLCLFRAFNPHFDFDGTYDVDLAEIKNLARIAKLAQDGDLAALEQLKVLVTPAQILRLLNGFWAALAQIVERYEDEDAGTK